MSQTKQKYDLENVRIEQKELTEVKEMLRSMCIWNVHYTLNTKQGYTYTNVLELNKGYSRIFIHLESQEQILKIVDNNEVKNKVFQNE